MKPIHELILIAIALLLVISACVCWDKFVIALEVIAIFIAYAYISVMASLVAILAYTVFLKERLDR